MARRPNPSEPLPPCYAMALPGLEAITAEEIRQDFRGEIKRTAPGRVVFRVPQIDERLLSLRTAEDVFLLAWGTDELTYRAIDLERICRWTQRAVDWNRLLQIHHAIRPKPSGKPTYRLVAQMSGARGYRRVDARRALEKGLAGKLPASWRHAEENAAVEIWLTIDEATAVCGLRLSDRTMRHRTYKMEHLPASLRPTVAAAMVRLADAGPNQVILDPMCGAGTILAEELCKNSRMGPRRVMGGDLDPSALRAARDNLRRLGSVHLARWNATRLPLISGSVERIISNPPFGKQLGRPENIGLLYQRILVEYDRVLRPRGRAVLLVSDWSLLKSAAEAVSWKMMQKFRVVVLGQRTSLSVWKKGS